MASELQGPHESYSRSPVPILISDAFL
jgi:hypothetical protein